MQTINDYIMPDTIGILTDEQLIDLGRIKIGLWKIKDAIEAVNTVAADSSLP